MMFEYRTVTLWTALVNEPEIMRREGLAGWELVAVVPEALDGWERVAVVPEADKRRYYFKRAIEPLGR